MAYFPTTPTDGQTVTVNGILYTYNATKGAWKRALSTINNLDAAGNITAANISVVSNVSANTIYTTSGIYWASNGVAFSSFPTALDANVGTLYLGNISTQANLGAYQTYANANAATQATSINTINANLGAYQTYANANISTLYLGNISTNANLGAFQTFSNTNAATQATSINTFNANLGAFQIFSNTNAATQATSINTFNANLGAYQLFANTNAATQATSINTINANLGAFEAYANTKIGTNTNSNLVVVATTTSTSTTTGALVVGGGAGIAGNVYTDKVFTTSGIYWATNNAPYIAAFTASSSPPASPSLGSYWYKTTTDVIYEYINDGVTDYWVDISTQTIAANTSAPSTYVGDVFGGNITFSGTITGSVGYLLERANVVASAAPATTNLDLLTAPIVYFTSNSSQNITANIRGNSTVTLNSMLAVGQSATFVIFMPNATAYYVSTVKIDNSTVTPFWQGGTTVASGNANSLDIYTFAVLKTADATFKVFASQVKYQNLGP